MKTQRKLTHQQLAILQLFSFSMNEQEVDDLKKVLGEFYDQRLQNELDKIWHERKLTDEQLQAEGQKHRRTQSQYG